MAGSVNKVILVGNLGKDPEVRRMQDGRPVVNLSVATSDTWRDKATGELLWRLPLGEAYDKQINSDAADMKNVGGRAGGSITAAQFIQRFIKDTPWAHLDIAGMAWSDKDAPTVPKGATAFGVRLLDRLVADYYEK